MTQRRDRFPAFGLMLHDMGNSYFSFKQFTVSQARSAMRVGTDGVLLGAWCDLGFSAEIMVAEGAEQTPWRILDVGTGTGVVALMAAQRVQHAQVDAVEPDEGSCLDAAQNFAGSPWSGRLRLYRTTLQEYVALVRGTVLYDRIVSHPPYFVDSLQSPDPGRNAGRHTVSLSYGELIEGVLALLAERGLFAVILPVHEGAVFEQMALERGLHVVRKLQVQTKPDVPAKRVLMEFARSQAPLRFATLVMETGRPQEYSEAYRGLTRDFYLKF